MKFLVDRCVGRRLADWLRSEGHDVVESQDRGSDPGDRVLLAPASAERRILVTIDTDFGHLIFAEGASHSGLVRLPDVPVARRIDLLKRVLEKHARELDSGAIATVRGGRIRISRPPD